MAASSDTTRRSLWLLHASSSAAQQLLSTVTHDQAAADASARARRLGLIAFIQAAVGAGFWEVLQQYLQLRLDFTTLDQVQPSRCRGHPRVWALQRGDRDCLHCPRLHRPWAQRSWTRYTPADSAGLGCSAAVRTRRSTWPWVHAAPTAAVPALSRSAGTRPCATCAPAPRVTPVRAGLADALRGCPQSILLTAIGAAGVFMQAVGLRAVVHALGETNLLRVCLFCYALEEVGPPCSGPGLVRQLPALGRGLAVPCLLCATCLVHSRPQQQ